MDTWSIGEIVSAIIKIIGGLALAIVPRLKNYERPRWVLTALFITGLSAIIGGLLFFVRLGFGSSLDTGTLYKISHFKTFFGGVGLGALLTLFISGELSPRKWK
ncbi:MAG: hypothetical protein HZB62_11875 [Nitrospirae bacterium]|nr:hypothetical protein [Nitrospirota bacterium]